MGTFILLLLFFFIILPIIRVIIAIYSAQRKARKAFEQFSRQQQQPRQGGWARDDQRRASRDRYDNIGEYAEFEEISTDSDATQGTSSASRKSIPRESQVVDAEWEDIK